MLLIKAVVAGKKEEELRIQGEKWAEERRKEMEEIADSQDSHHIFYEIDWHCDCEFFSVFVILLLLTQDLYHCRGNDPSNTWNEILTVQ